MGIKGKESNPDSESDSENTGKGQTIDVDPTAIVVMLVKGTPLHFIVDSGSQKNLISAEVVKQLGLSTTPHPQP
jgi:hypothetical protein